MTSFLVRLTDEDADALRAQAEADGVSMNDVALRAIRDATSRRALLKSYLAEIDRDHAATLVELADR